jgi:uncharacterized protein
MPGLRFEWDEEKNVAVLRVLVVCHCYRSGGDVIRLISARKANDTERHAYHHRKRT